LIKPEDTALSLSFVSKWENQVEKEGERMKEKRRTF
jgi:hypothetical protein